MIGAVGLHADFQDTVQFQRWVKVFEYALLGRRPPAGVPVRRVRVRPAFANEWSFLCGTVS